MKMTAYTFPRTFLTLIVLTSVCQAQAVSGSVEEKKISITVSAAPWTLTLADENLVLEKEQIKTDGRQGYFSFSNSKNNLNVSMFIEPVSKCKTSRECRDLVWKAGNPGWEKPQNVVLSEIGDVSFFEFLVPSFKGTPIRQQNMYAQFVIDGFWVDVHISKALYQPQEHLLFERLVKAIKFAPKKRTNIVLTAESPERAAQTAVETWVLLWDSGKYDESYQGLAEHTKKNLPQKQWFVYWATARKPLGRVRFRKLIEANYMKSLPGVPDREGAILRYESSFENKDSVVESFGLMQEKDGTWRVANYLN